MQQAPKITGISQIGLVVRDCMATARTYEAEYGIGPWQTIEMGPATVADMRIRGKPEPHAMRVAITRIGNVLIELVQPLDDKSIYAEFLKEHGEGIHHVHFDIADYDSALTFFNGKWGGILQGGTISGTDYAYFDTQKALGMITAIAGKRHPS